MLNTIQVMGNNKIGFVLMLLCCFSLCLNKTFFGLKAIFLLGVNILSCFFSQVFMRMFSNKIYKWRNVIPVILLSRCSVLTLKHKKEKRKYQMGQRIKLPCVFKD